MSTMQAVGFPSDEVWLPAATEVAGTVGLAIGLFWCPVGATTHRAHQFLVVGAVPGRDQATLLAKAWDALRPHSDGAYMGFGT